MADTVTITLAQINVTVGALEANKQRILDAYHQAVAQQADLVVFPECAVLGYPPEDLVLRRSFQDKTEHINQQIAQATQGKPTAMLVGSIGVIEGKLYNTALLMQDGRITHTTLKQQLPNSGVFDERRIFTAGQDSSVVQVAGMTIGILICEDIWEGNIAEQLATKGAELLIALNASPFEHHKQKVRRQIVKHHSNQSGLPVIYTNMVGGQDELVFDGCSFVMNQTGDIATTLPAFKEIIYPTMWKKDNTHWSCAKNDSFEQQAVNDREYTYHALVVGLRDYIQKNGFPGIVIGMSGGIDSALSAAIAVDAIGAEHVTCVMMPSAYTSEESLQDARKCCEYLGVGLESVSISPMVEGMREALKDHLQPINKNYTTYENIQARIRGNILMSLSNFTGKMVLTTGNKSEMAVGYATLYGDMCGGFSVLKDLYKMEVVALCHYRNHHYDNTLWRGNEGRVIPENIITKPPTAELRPDQKDSDSLPAYEILDDILHGLIEEALPREEIVAKGHDVETVNHVATMLYRSEYKRRQAPPGIKVTGLAFGRDRRYPITCKI